MEKMQKNRQKILGEFLGISPKKNGNEKFLNFSQNYP
jgi:hypothetical protein